MKARSGLAALILASAVAPYSYAAVVTRIPAEAFSAAGSAGAAASFAWTQPQALAHYEAARQEFWSTVGEIGLIPAEQRTFVNTVAALEGARARLEERISPAGFLGLVSPDAKVRAALSGHLTPVLAREADAQRAVREYEAHGEAPTGADKLLLEEMKRDFRLDGAGLDAASVDRMQKVSVRLRELENYFSRNTWDDKSAVTASPGELDGLPADLLARLKRGEDGSVAIPVNSPSVYQAVMSRASHSGLRHRAALAHDRIGSAFNGADLDEALALRAEQARLLGSRSYAHLAMEGRSVKSPWAGARFLNGLRGALARAVGREDAELLELKRRDEPGAERLNSWDVPYYTRRLLESRGFDEAGARAYFPADKTVAAVLRRLEPALGVRFVVQDAPAWHPSVRLYAVEDENGGRLGSFYLDAYQREGKTGGRFVQALVRGRELPGGGYREPVFAVVLNFAEPHNGRSVELGHEELVGLLHELGHVLDDTLTEARYARFAGGAFGSGLDRAEIPSQMLEQLAWNPAFLASVSGRDGDASRIPDTLLDGMLAHARVGRARTIMTWAARAAIDLALHSLRPPQDASRMVDRLFARFGLPPLPAGHMYQASFGHLMGAYSAGYYTYLLTLNRALDLYERFGATGPIEAAGRDYRRAVLAPGGERELDAAARDFLRREPDPRALERFLKAL